MAIVTDPDGSVWDVWPDGSRHHVILIGGGDGANGQADDGGYQDTIDAVTQDNGSDAGSPDGNGAPGLGNSLDGFADKNHKWLWVALVALGLVMVVASHKRRR